MKNLFLETLDKKVLVFDGAMGTNLQKQDLTAADFGGHEGCNESLILYKPEAVGIVHESFFKAGSDAVETDTFGANRIVLAEYGLAEKAKEINRKAAELARGFAKKYSTTAKPRFVAGSIGPTSKLPALGHISFDAMQSAYEEQVEGLMEGGVDVLLIETCQDILQTKIAVIAAREVFKRMDRSVPIMTQVTIESAGAMLLGTDIASALTTLEALDVDVIGMNCATGPDEMAENVRFLTQNSRKFISVLPNAGIPENVNGAAHYKLSPEKFAGTLERFVKEFGVNIVGGCCGTSPEHLEALAKKVSGLPPKKRAVTQEPSCSSLYNSVPYRQEPAPFLIGERTNANGSKKFRQLLEKNDFESIVAMGKEAVREGSHALDVCCAMVGRNELEDMAEVVSRFNLQVTIPIVIDSTEEAVMEAALKRASGKTILNSINLEDGEERMKKVCPLAKKYGAALIALTIDESGMAKTCAKKVEIAERIYRLATEKYSIRGEDIFFDCLTFTLGSGDADFRSAGIETLNAIRAVKQRFPEVQTVLGVSNISFGLDAESRHVLNSVFLHYAVEAGLDAAIVHAARIMPLHKIDEETREITRRLIFNEPLNGADPLKAFITHFEARKGIVHAAKDRERVTSIEEALKDHIVDGDLEGLNQDLEKALKKYPPLEIINTFLMDGMRTVGDLFGGGKMQLPFVLQSAEVMKRAVDILEPHLKKSAASEKGRIVIATVQGDVHDIGKNLVDIILANNGYSVFNIGIKQSLDSILKAADEHKADAIGLSGLLVRSTVMMKEYVEDMDRRGLTIPVILSGAAVTPKFVSDTVQPLYRGKVYYAKDAFSALKIMEDVKASKGI